MIASNQRNNIVQLVFVGRMENENGEGRLKPMRTAKRLNHQGEAWGRQTSPVQNLVLVQSLGDRAASEKNTGGRNPVKQHSPSSPGGTPEGESQRGPREDWGTGCPSEEREAETSGIRKARAVSNAVQRSKEPPLA